jgi:hypothetical protein
MNQDYYPEYDIFVKYLMTILILDSLLFLIIPSLILFGYLF